MFQAPVCPLGSSLARLYDNALALFDPTSPTGNVDCGIEDAPHVVRNPTGTSNHSVQTPGPDGVQPEEDNIPGTCLPNQLSHAGVEPAGPIDSTMNANPDAVDFSQDDDAGDKPSPSGTTVVYEHFGQPDIDDLIDDLVDQIVSRRWYNGTLQLRCKIIRGGGSEQR
jgi:hypothetical protein